MMKDLAFDMPVRLRSAAAAIRTADEAACFLRSHLRDRVTFAGLNALLKLERAAEGDEVVEEARQAFCSWASGEQLLGSRA
jgi:hypothetical protein